MAEFVVSCLIASVIFFLVFIFLNIAGIVSSSGLAARIILPAAFALILCWPVAVGIDYFGGCYVRP